MATAAAIQDLIDELSDHRTRAAGRRGLRAVGQRAEQPLLALLEDLEAPRNQRWAAITLLAELKSQAAVPTLVRIMTDDGNLLGDAARALETITGRELGEDTVAWEQALQGAPPGTATVAVAPAEAPPLQEAPDTAPHAQFVREALRDCATEITWEADGYARASLSTSGGRRQQVLIAFGGSDDAGREAVLLYTECGSAPKQAAELLVASNEALSYGKFAVEQDEDGGDKVVMRHYIPVSELSTDGLRRAAESMATEADALELALTGEDIV